MYYMVVTVYNIIWHIRCDNVKNEIIGCLIMDEIVVRLCLPKSACQVTHSMLHIQF